MLLELQVRNFLIIESLDLNFTRGMTVITGETGAGKSILLDALQFVMGSRADAKFIRSGTQAASVTLQLDEFILKRVMSEDGRSRAYINGDLASIGELKNLGEAHCSWVGQYEHQALLRMDAQRDALDTFAKNENLLKEVGTSAKKIKTVMEQLQSLQERAAKEQEVMAFKNYQLEVLQDLGLIQTEWDELHQEQRRLSSGQDVLTKIAAMLNCLREEEVNLLAQVKRIEREMSALAEEFTELKNPAQLSTDALVSLEEAYHELKSFYDRLELDPERLAQVEARLSQIHTASRKLQVQAEELYAYHQKLKDELQTLGSLDAEMKACEAAVQQEKSHYDALSKQLTEIRTEAAQKLAKYVTDEIKTLGMKEGQFAIKIMPIEGFSEKGRDQIEFQVRMNPGQAWSSLKDGASGGELSRIALVLAVVNAKQNQAQTLIFDEVDVGVSGAVAEKVGHLLHALAQETQVLCITHLPQVAMLGDHHIHVAKTFKAGQTFGSARILDHEERIEEIARMMSGESITEHARQLVREKLTP